MVFSKEAVKSLVKTCSCPNVDSPDDMIIGLLFSFTSSSQGDYFRNV